MCSTAHEMRDLFNVYVKKTMQYEQVNKRDQLDGLDSLILQNKVTFKHFIL